MLELGGSNVSSLDDLSQIVSRPFLFSPPPCPPLLKYIPPASESEARFHSTLSLNIQYSIPVYTYSDYT